MGRWDGDVMGGEMAKVIEKWYYDSHQWGPKRFLEKRLFCFGKCSRAATEGSYGRLARKRTGGPTSYVLSTDILCMVALLKVHEAEAATVVGARAQEASALY